MYLFLLQNLQEQQSHHLHVKQLRLRPSEQCQPVCRLASTMFEWEVHKLGATMPNHEAEKCPRHNLDEKQRSRMRGALEMRM